MKKSQLRNIIRESVKSLLTEQACNSYQSRTPGDFSQPGPTDACAAWVLAVRCDDIPSSYTYSLAQVQSGQICTDIQAITGTNPCYQDDWRIQIQGSNQPFTLSGNCANGWTPVPGDHMLSHNTAQGPAYVAWLVVGVSHFGANCAGPRREWFSCSPGWNSAGCMDPALPLYSSTHTEDCAGNTIPNAAGTYGDTSCCGVIGVGGCMGDPVSISTGNANPGICVSTGQPYSWGVLNYNPLATFDDGSCLPIIYGCTDNTTVNGCGVGCNGAFNYYSAACVDDGTCVYAVYGCTNSFSPNYDPNANIDDGSCIFPILDCPDPAANNFNPDPLVIGCDNYSGFCDDPTITGYNPQICAGNTSCCTYTHRDPPEDCCEWCITLLTSPNPTLPAPAECKDWMCTDPQWISDHCPELGTGGGPEDLTDPEIERMKDLAGIKK